MPNESPTSADALGRGICDSYGVFVVGRLSRRGAMAPEPTVRFSFGLKGALSDSVCLFGALRGDVRWEHVAVSLGRVERPFVIHIRQGVAYGT